MSFLKGKMASDLARRRCSGEEQLLACGKIARGHTAKVLLDKIMANVLMETIMNPQGIMTQVMYKNGSQLAYLCTVPLWYCN